MHLNKFGRIVEEEWNKTGKIRPNIEIDKYVIMPNHLHGIIIVNCRSTLQRAPMYERYEKPMSNSIPTIVRLFKSSITQKINILRNTPGFPIWQRNYYEHIIRDEDDYLNISRYIENNPLKWELDKYYGDEKGGI